MQGWTTAHIDTIKLSLRQNFSLQLNLTLLVIGSDNDNT